MRVVAFTLPQKPANVSASKGADILHDFEHSLAFCFGGYTRFECFGVWKDPNGGQFDESNYYYRVAIRPDDQARLIDGLVEVKHALREQDIYFEDCDGEVWFL